jgi:hypothetical protein
MLGAVDSSSALPYRIHRQCLRKTCAIVDPSLIQCGFHFRFCLLTYVDTHLLPAIFTLFIPFTSHTHTQKTCVVPSATYWCLWRVLYGYLNITLVLYLLLANSPFLELGFRDRLAIHPRPIYWPLDSHRLRTTYHMRQKKAVVLWPLPDARRFSYLIFSYLCLTHLNIYVSHTSFTV